MQKAWRIRDWDIFYLSYDEPNAEENWERIQSICPWAKRVHGVKGSDAAHKACARQADSDRFTTIDGDNWVPDELLDMRWQFESDWDITNSVLSFPAKNPVNGLVYGNGGIKNWPTAVVLNMQTHESATDPDSSAGVDFCWVLDYILMPGCWSEARINATDNQAWRAGFREGVKFSMVEGQGCKDPLLWNERTHRVNQARLTQWMQVGLDAENGIWSVMGARQGFYMAMFTDWDPANVQDFDILQDIWYNRTEQQDLFGACRKYAAEIRSQLPHLVTENPLDPQQSLWWKQQQVVEQRTQPKRLR
jgi:hypothetical protein